MWELRARRTESGRGLRALRPALASGCGQRLRIARRHNGRFGRLRTKVFVVRYRALGGASARGTQVMEESFWHGSAAKCRHSYVVVQMALEKLSQLESERKAPGEVRAQARRPSERIGPPSRSADASDHGVIVEGWPRPRRERSRRPKMSGHRRRIQPEAPLGLPKNL